VESWICVLGMHRSGTSCLAGMLRRSGVYLGEVQEHSPDNPLGNQELRQIWDLGDALLAENGGAWGKPVMVSHWRESHRRERDAILQNLRDAAARAQSPLWGFKDPRTLFTLPFWLEALPPPRFIASFRQPQRVALSLNARNAISVEDGLRLWAAYNGKLLELVRKHRFPLLNFDLPPGAYLKDAEAKFPMLGPDLQLSTEAKNFFRPELAHWTDANAEEVRLSGDVAELYQKLQKHHQSFMSRFRANARRWLAKIPPPPPQGKKECRV